MFQFCPTCYGKWKYQPTLVSTLVHQWCEWLLNWITVFKYWKNISSIFGAIHNVKTTGTTHFKVLSALLTFFPHYILKSRQSTNNGPRLSWNICLFLLCYNFIMAYFKGCYRMWSWEEMSILLDDISTPQMQ